MNMIAIIVFKFLELLCRLLRFFVAWLIISLPFFWLLCVADGSPRQALGIDSSSSSSSSHIPARTSKCHAL